MVITVMGVNREGGGYGDAPPGKSRKKVPLFPPDQFLHGFPSNVCLKIKNKHLKKKPYFLDTLYPALIH